MIKKYTCNIMYNLRYIVVGPRLFNTVWLFYKLWVLDAEGSVVFIFKVMYFDNNSLKLTRDIQTPLSRAPSKLGWNWSVKLSSCIESLTYHPELLEDA